MLLFATNLFLGLTGVAILTSLFCFLIWKYEGYKQNKNEK